MENDSRPLGLDEAFDFTSDFAADFVEGGVTDDFDPFVYLDDEVVYDSTNDARMNPLFNAFKESSDASIGEFRK